MPATTLLIHGTASVVGKSVVAAALARLFWCAGRRVVPFKAQNLSLNAVVAAGTLPGEPEGEIGWAQALQAAACGLSPTLDMNPVLLKPTAGGCQRILRGRVADDAAYGNYSPGELLMVREALERLRAAHDLVLIEGAGSPAELNLLDRDLANGKVADWTDGPILLVGDISAGGVFAALYGTWALSPHRERIRGFIINKLHGGAEPLAAGVAELERRTGVPTLGVIPNGDPGLGQEDSLGLCGGANDGWGLRVAVVRLPHISNTTDFEELARWPGVSLRYVWSEAELRSAQVIILPGTKSTVADLDAMRAEGLAKIVAQRVHQGVSVLGICGGYQMLGQAIHDPFGVESAPGSVQGLGLLPVETWFDTAKRTETRPEGYFIHHGRTRLLDGDDGDWPDDAEGCCRGRVAGTALHGWLRGPALAEWVRQWQRWNGAEPAYHPAGPDLEQRLQAWAELVRSNLDWNCVRQLA
ncbi:MAG: cobyric acid synthase [Terriglobales bacterium]